MSRSIVSGSTYAFVNFKFGSYLSASNTTTVNPVQGQPNLTDWWLLTSNPKDPNLMTLRHGNTCKYMGVQGANVVVGANNNAPAEWYMWTANNDGYYIIARPGTYLNVGLPSSAAGTNVTLKTTQFNFNGAVADRTQFWAVVDVTQPNGQPVNTCH